MKSPTRFITALALAVGLAAAPLAAQAAETPRTITVSGQGEARGVPNQAQLSAGVTTVAATADAALRENARKMNAVFAALKKLGVPERAIQTSNFSIQPQYPPYNQNNTGLQKIIGYQVSNQVDVVLDDTGKLGPALDVLVAAGANQINSVSFGIKDTDALDAKARESAVEDAMTRARTYAKAAGVTLGSVVSIQESGGYQPPRPMMMLKEQAAADAATPTAAGEMGVTANVTVVFEIR